MPVRRWPCARKRRGVPRVLEVSIGHALIGEALYRGLDATVRRYLEVIAHA